MASSNVRFSVTGMSEEEEREWAVSAIVAALLKYNKSTGSFGASIDAKTKSKTAKNNRSSPRMSILYGTLLKLYGICFSYYCGESEFDDEVLDERKIDKPRCHLPVRKLLSEASKRMEGRDLKVDRRLVSAWGKVIEALFEKKVYPRNFYSELMRAGGVEALRLRRQEEIAPKRFK